MAMADNEVKEFFLQQRVLDAAENHRRIAFADFRNHHADGEAAPLAQSAGESVGFVIEQRSRLDDSLLRLGGDAKLATGMIEHARHGSRRKTEMGCEIFDPDAPPGMHRLVFP